MEVAVARDDAADAVLAHQGGGVEVVHQVVARVRDVGEASVQDRGVALRGAQHASAGRPQQDAQERVGLADGPRSGVDTRMGGDAQELVGDAPGEEPGCGPRPRVLEQAATREVELAAGVGGVEQDVGVDDEQRDQSRSSSA